MLDSVDAVYRECSLPGMQRYAAAYGATLHMMDALALQRRRERRRRLSERLGIEPSAFDQFIVSDGHFGKFEVFGDAIERGYAEIAFVDLDVVVNERADVPNIFEAAALPTQRPAVAMYSQGRPNDVVYAAIRDINPRLNVSQDAADYWNSGVVVINRRGMQTLKALVEELYVQYIARGRIIEKLPVRFS